MATNRIKEFVRQNQRPRRGEPLMPWLSKELMTKFKSCLYLSVLLYPRKAAWNWKKLLWKSVDNYDFWKSTDLNRKIRENCYLLDMWYTYLLDMWYTYLLDMWYTYFQEMMRILLIMPTLLFLPVPLVAKNTVPGFHFKDNKVEYRVSHVTGQFQDDF